MTVRAHPPGPGGRDVDSVGALVWDSLDEYHRTVQPGPRLMTVQHLTLMLQDLYEMEADVVRPHVVTWLEQARGELP